MSRIMFSLLVILVSFVSQAMGCELPTFTLVDKETFAPIMNMESFKYDPEARAYLIPQKGEEDLIFLSEEVFVSSPDGEFEAIENRLVFKPSVLDIAVNATVALPYHKTQHQYHLNESVMEAVAATLKIGDGNTTLSGWLKSHPQYIFK